MKSFQIRGISRELNLAVTSVSRYLKDLVGEGLVIKGKRGIYMSYWANRDNDRFKFYKMLDTLIVLEESGLTEKIHSECLPDSIILFGSASRGEDVPDSDVDIFVQSKEKNIGIKKYEKALRRKINLFFESDFSGLSTELKNNILNGITLRGYLKVF